MDIKRVGFVGLGAMGSPIARNLLRRGFEVTGYDLSREALDRHANAGGITASSPADAATGADVVVTVLPDGPDVERAVLGEDGIAEALSPGAVLIEMSTIDPAVTRRVGEELARRAIHMVDCPVGKTVEHAISGTLTLMVGGKQETVQSIRPILNCMGTDIFYCGGLGMGEAMKLTNNFLAATILAATSEALVLGVKAGLDLGVIIDIMRTTMAWNNQLAVALPRKAMAGDFSPGFTVRLAEKDQRLALRMAAALGVASPVGGAAHTVLLEATRKGLANLDISAVLKLREDQAGVKVRGAAAVSPPAA